MKKKQRNFKSKIKKNTFDFNDFRDQINQVQKMGDMKDIVGMIPGMKKALKGTEVDNKAFNPIIAMIDSMTPKERSSPTADKSK